MYYVCPFIPFMKKNVPIAKKSGGNSLWGNFQRFPMTRISQEESLPGTPWVGAVSLFPPQCSALHMSPTHNVCIIS